MTMEFDEIVVKENPGLCRCCLSEGCYKDLGSEHIWMNETEVYAEMLLDCFDISISQQNEGPNGLNRLICEVCITRLRDACNFKKQVLESEKKFVDMVGRGEFKSKMLVYQARMKREGAPPEESAEETVEYLDEDIDFDEEAEELNDEPAPTVSEVTVSSRPVKSKRGRPKKKGEKSEKKAKVVKMEEKPKTSKAVAKDAMASSKLATYEHNITPNMDSAKIKSQLITLLQKTTAIPFTRRTDRKYRCFYCYCTFTQPSKLRIHTMSSHEHEDFNGGWMRSRFDLESSLMLDIFEFKCRLCDKNLSDCNDMNTHFSENHDIIFSIDTFDYVICFKLTDDVLKCYLCLQRYSFFTRLLHHVQSHLHKKCRFCRGDINSRNVVHDLPYCKPCSVCDMRFQSKNHIKIHQKNVHCKSFQCTRVEMHQLNGHCQTFQCNYCSKIYKTKNSLAIHIRNVHNKERNLICDVCGCSFFNMHHLRLHKMRHDNIRRFECEICKNRFFSKATLNKHMRIHNNDRRYVCKLCGKAFVHWTSLEGHKLTHSSEKTIKCKCGQAFKSKKFMRKHYKEAHDIDRHVLMTRVSE